MSLNFFGLRQTPFGEVDSASLFWTPQRRDLASAFRSTIVERRGIVLLTGEDGSGKTSFVDAVLSGLASQPMKIITLSPKKLSFSMLLDTLIRELGGTVEQESTDPGTSTPTTEIITQPLAPLEDIVSRIRALHAALLTTCTEQEGSMVVLVIDNAHQLPIKTLKDFPWLSVLEAQGRKLLQTIFIGNATLSLKLEMPQLQQLKQRIAASGELTPFSLEESFVYLLARTRAKVGPRPSSPLFSVEALRLLAHHGKGNPRTLNALANAALQAGAVRKQKPISGPLILEVIAEARTLRMINRPVAAQNRLPRPRVSPRINPRRATPLPTGRQLWSASIGALAAALVLFFYHNAKDSWNAMLQKPFDFFRKSIVAQAAPAPIPAPASFSLPEDQSPAEEISPSSRVTKSDHSEKKRRKLTKLREQPEDSSTTSAPAPKLKDNGPGKAWNSLPGGPLQHGLGHDAGVPDLLLRGKILYRIPPDPTSNKDRLFDE